MANKQFLFILFLSCIGFSQSDTITVSSNSTLEEEIYSEYQDSLYSTENYIITPKTFDPNFQEKYTDDEFIYETVIDNKELTAWERFWRAIKNFFERLFDFGSLGRSISGLEIIMKIIAFIIIGFVIYMIVKVIINKEGQWIFGKKNKKITVSELVEENIHSINFNEIIKKSKQEKDYRLTIRYYYLWLLKSYSDKELIEWDIEKTNSDYLSELKSQNTKENFKYLSYIYDYSWYGEFEINEPDFLKAETVFLKAIQEK
ncbi:hypothetical protein SY27_00210 [Flavobacterium sp. 316]|uniref:hypothetical protein n=1 Tax=Flavobacterium sp. 316 TaxID=1603293 RepID=UPI0005E83C03|nr:hypothetical protein [Flavobacterium sp. 316]KIX22325.1 hypothetical protein SY27_00210 [Flavobacterium sp. 316]